MACTDLYAYTSITHKTERVMIFVLILKRLIKINNSKKRLNCQNISNYIHDSKIQKCGKKNIV